ncbi:MAG: DNA mismatch repair protein MutS [Myxococcota bacterium]
MTEPLQSRLEARLASPKLTPMMRQYLTVKSEYPQAIVLFRMGDFFETFFEDAEECARRLDITLTARSKERDIPMAGVPHHSVDGYLSRLIEQGCTVVMVDQVEDPKKAKGLVRREITRVITPGTFLDPNAPAREANYLVSLHLQKLRRGSSKTKGWGLAALDLATGDFRATCGEGEEALLDELARLDTSEIVLLESQAEAPAFVTIHSSRPRLLLTRLDDRDHTEDRSLEALDLLIGKEEREALGALLPDIALWAAGRALLYARTTQVRPEAPDLKGEAGLGHIHTLRPYVPGDALVLDREAREHLELFSSAGGGRGRSLLGSIDRAVTPMGGRLLAEWLAYPSLDRVEIRARHGAVAAFASTPAALDAIREHLRAVSDAERLVGRVVLGRALPRDLAALRGALEAAPSVLDAARSSEAGQAGLLAEAPPDGRLSQLARTDLCEDVKRALTEALVEEPVNDLSGGAVFRAGYDRELDEHTRLADQGKALISDLEAAERERSGIPNLKIRYNKVFGYYLEVTKTHLALVPDRYIRKQTTVNTERFFTDELKTLEDDVLHAAERKLARAEHLYAELMARISSEAPRLRTLAASLAELDVLAAFAHLAETLDWARPELGADDVIDIRDGRHPVLEQLAGELGERFVPNDVRLSREERLVIVTGPNMAGKSTIMRQTALLVVLAHMGSFVPARSAHVGRVDRIFTRVGASDDLSRGRSTFMVEMTETSRILRSATAHDLIILDEIGRGTSTYDGLSIAWAVAEHLHDVVQARTLFATHYHELTELCRDKPAAVNRHVAVREHEDDIVFLRKLQPGATNRSYGVQVARLAGLPKVVIARARRVLDGLEAQALRHGAGSAVQHLLSARARRENQLSLFDGAGADRPADGDVRKLLDALRAIELDEVSPRRAFELLGELQDMLPDSRDP